MKKEKTGYGFYIGIGITSVMLTLIIIGYFVTPYGAEDMNGAVKLVPPSFSHLFGTDQFGRDIFSRVLKGAGNTVFIALGTLFIGGGIGVLVGMFTGYFGSWLDEILMRISDMLASFPGVFLALILVSILGAGRNNVMVILGIVFIPSYARIVRGEVYRCKEEDYVKRAKLLGASNIRIMLVHILPNIVPALFSALLIGFNNTIIAEAGLSYLGIGVQPPEASLGRMLSEAQGYITTGPWYVIFPGIFIIVLVLGVSLLENGILERFGGGR